MRFTRPHQEENHFARRVLGNFKAAAWHWRSRRLLVSFNAAEPSSEAHRPQSCRPRALIAMWFEVCGPSEVSFGKTKWTEFAPRRAISRPSSDRYIPVQIRHIIQSPGLPEKPDRYRHSGSGCRKCPGAHAVIVAAARSPDTATSVEHRGAACGGRRSFLFPKPGNPGGNPPGSFGPRPRSPSGSPPGNPP
jgi:hypothetical protein